MNKETKLKELKREIYYYTGIVPTSEEVLEIYDFLEMNPNASIEEVVSDYYACE